MAKITTDRECGDCTACCDGWLKADVDGQNLVPGNPCKHVGPKGCGIYDSRPVHPCRVFKCHWLTDPDLPNWLTPKNSKVILKANFVWKRPSSDIPVTIAITVGPRVPGKTRQWLSSYAESSRRNILCMEPIRVGKRFTGDRHTFGIGSPSFVKEVKHWNDNGYELLVRPA